MEKDIINLLINGSISTILGVTVIILCYKCLQLFFDNRLESKKSELLKDIEVYKIELEKEKDAFMVKIEQDKQKFQSELDKQLTEHSVLFNSLNTERFKLCNELFGVLVNILGMGKNYVSYVKSVPLDQTLEEFEKAQLDDFEKEYLTFWKLYSPNRLFFDEDLSAKIRALADEIHKNVIEHAFKKRFNFEGFGDDKVNVMKENSEKILAVEPRMKIIENEMRQLLGVIK